MHVHNSAKLRVSIGEFRHLTCVFVDGRPMLYGQNPRDMKRFAVRLRASLSEEPPPTPGTTGNSAHPNDTDTKHDSSRDRANRTSFTHRGTPAFRAPHSTSALSP